MNMLLWHTYKNNFLPPPPPPPPYDCAMRIDTLHDFYRCLFLLFALKKDVLYGRQ